MTVSDDLRLNILPGHFSRGVNEVSAWQIAASPPLNHTQNEIQRNLARLCWQLDRADLSAIPYQQGILAVGDRVPWPVHNSPYPLSEPERVSLSSESMEGAIEQLLTRVVTREARSLGYSKWRTKYVRGGSFIRTASAEGLPIEVNRDAFEIRIVVRNNRPFLLLDLSSAMRQPLPLTIGHMQDRGMSEQDIRKVLEGRDVVAEHYSLSGVITGVKWIPVCDSALQPSGRSLVDYWADFGVELDPEERPVIEVLLRGINKKADYPASQLNLSIRGIRLQRDESLQLHPNKRMTSILAHPILTRPLHLGALEVNFDRSFLSVSEMSKMGLASCSGLIPQPDLEFGEKRQSRDPRSVLTYGPAGGPRDIRVIYAVPDDFPINELHAALASYYEKWGFGALGLGDIVSFHGEDRIAYYRAGQTASKTASDEETLIIGVIDGATESYRAFKRGVDSSGSQARRGVQVVKRSTAMGIIAGKQWLAADLLSQGYVKASRRPAWLLANPAGKTMGNAYLAFDVSRRMVTEVDDKKEIVSSTSREASAIASMCDEFGKILVWETYTNHSGEILGYQEAWDILTAALDNIRKSRMEEFKRLVVYKDGPIREAERSSIVRAAKEVRDDYMGETGKNVMIDIVSAVKTGIERIVVRQGDRYDNPSRGTYILMPDRRALVVSSFPRIGTADPMRLKYEATVGGDWKSMETIVHEFFDLTNLDWRSIYQQPKTPLVLQLVQSLGEMLTLDIDQPSYVPL